MHLIILCHPPSLGSTSMPRFARLIGEGMRSRGHTVEYLTSSRVFSCLTPFAPRKLGKWLGYIDQFLLFPLQLRRRARTAPADTVFVVADQALGMWVPTIKRRAHVVHCHDFLAQRSALGEFPENPTGWSGRQYQRLIRRGYRQARNFISVSEKTQADLHAFLGRSPARSVVISNPLNYPFKPLPRTEALEMLASRIPVNLAGGYILHVGGNQWYKNREGVVAAYQVYHRASVAPVPLLLVGAPPSPELRRAVTGDRSSAADVHFAVGLTDTEVHAAYAAASALFFPSLEEGFGWPIIEAQACGCPVITTDHDPMREVAGEGAILLRRRRFGSDDEWAVEGARKLTQITAASNDDSMNKIRRCVRSRPRDLDAQIAFEQYQKAYQHALSEPNDGWH